ncbi:Fic family protein [Pseudoscardovia radai]|uniref:Fic family protein n=1 Tax=Pseudoscardovia radai TaxID=987066 RepID=UPI00399445A1
MPNKQLSIKIGKLPELLDSLGKTPEIENSLWNAEASKNMLDSLYPLDGVEESALEDYRKDWLSRYVYNSNAMEGSTLSLPDTELVLDGEFLPTDGPARYVFAAKGCADGMEMVRRFAREGRPLDADAILMLHQVTALDVQPVLRGTFRPYGYTVRIRDTRVKTADPLEIWDDMEALIHAIDSCNAHPILKAAGFHAMFENIHPFADGNGRTGRQILNWMLLRAGYAPICIRHDTGREYMNCLERWQVFDDPAPLISIISKCIVHEQDSIAGIIDDVRNPPEQSHSMTPPEINGPDDGISQPGI